MRQIGEVVIVNIDGNPTFYAKVESITPDNKPKWFEFEFVILSFPLQKATWILREEYIDGKEFTMGGVPVKIISLPHVNSVTENPSSAITNHQGRCKILSLSEKRNKKNEIKF